MRILYLNVSEKPFEVMISGEKNKEYRKNSQWIVSRLFDSKTGRKKKFDLIKIIWGYGADRPYFIARFKYFITSERHFTKTFSNGLKVEIEKDDFIIHFGKILETHLIKPNTLFNNDHS